jgi:hypothetical protein
MRPPAAHGLLTVPGMLALALPAAADVVLLQNGKAFEGKITSETAHEVVIDTVVSRIRLSMTFPRTDVRSIEHKPVPDGFFEAVATPKEPAKKPAAEPAKPVDPAAPGAYLEVPLVGTFGEEIYPKGVEAALQAAVDRGIKHVVFRIKSGGGEVWAASKIAEVLGKFQGKVTTHVLIEEALSASIWVVFSCDTIEIAPGGTLGAAVVFKKDHSTGAAEVDKKLNSALAAELGAIAERHGRDPAIVRAMIMPEAELYSWTERGAVKISGQRPQPSPPDLTVLSTAEDVLTLTPDEATRLGLARKVDRADSSLVGPAEGLKEWVLVDGTGAQVFQKACRESADARTELQRVATNLKEAIVTAVEEDPRHHSYQVTPNGEMTSDSKRRWTELTDKALASWAKAKQALTAFNQAVAKAPSHGLEGFVTSRLTDSELKYTLGQIDTRMAELRKDRMRNNLPPEFERK